MQSLFKVRPRTLVAILGAGVIAAIAAPAIAASAAGAQPAHHERSAAEIVGALDTAYQAAVKINDARTMDRILDDDFALVVGSGSHFTKSDLVDSATAKECTYEHQEEVAPKEGVPVHTVRVYGRSTAIVTAELWEKGTCPDSKGPNPFDSHLWFSDTYTFRDGHWGYSFGQASRALAPPAPPAS
jgi:hypothetical protein